MPVYLAEVTDDLDDKRHLIENELAQWNIPVLPDRLLPRDASAVIDTVQSHLAKSALSVHMVGRHYGWRPRGDRNNRSLVQIQYDLACDVAAQRRGHFQQIIWVPPDLKSADLDDRQRQFLELLKHAPCDERAELIQTNFEDLKDFLLDRLQPPGRRRQPELGYGGPGPLVFISGQAKDLSTQDATAIIQCCRERKYDVVTSPIRENGGDPAWQGHDETNTKHCDALLILYGQCPADWVTERALHAREVTLRRRDKPLTRAIYDAPPSSKADLPFFFQDFLVLDGRRGFDASVLQPFFDRIEMQIAG